MVLYVLLLICGMTMFVCFYNLFHQELGQADTNIAQNKLDNNNVFTITIIDTNYWYPR